MVSRFLLVELRLYRSRHQTFDDLTRWQRFIERAIDALADGHVDAVALRHEPNRAGGEIAFDDLTDLGQSGFDTASCCQQQTETTVTRLIIRAGQHEIAQSREAHESFFLGAERHTEAGHLHQTARNQRHSRIGAKA